MGQPSSQWRAPETGATVRVADDLSNHVWECRTSALKDVARIRELVIEYQRDGKGGSHGPA